MYNMRLRAHEVTSIGKEIVYVRQNVGKDVLSIRRSFYYLSCPSYFPFFLSVLTYLEPRKRITSDFACLRDETNKQEIKEKPQKSRKCASEFFVYSVKLAQRGILFAARGFYRSSRIRKNKLANGNHDPTARIYYIYIYELYIYTNTKKKKRNLVDLSIAPICLPWNDYV